MRTEEYVNMTIANLKIIPIFTKFIP